MHSINLIREETAATLHTVIVKLVPFRCSRNFRAGEFCKRMQCQAVDHEEGCVAQAECEYEQYAEDHVLFRLSCW